MVYSRSVCNETYVYHSSCFILNSAQHAASSVIDATCSTMCSDCQYSTVPHDLVSNLRVRIQLVYTLYYYNTDTAKVSELCLHQGGEGRTPKTMIALKLPDFRLDVRVKQTSYIYKSLMTRQ
jgi:hypothetical protein